MGSARILVVDDDGFIRKLIQQHLSGQGYAVQLESSADDALEAMKTDDFDLMITDIVMPQKDGGRLIKAARLIGYKKPIIAITGGVENALEDYTSYADMFADRTLTKPVPRGELISVVRYLLGDTAPC